MIRVVERRSAMASRAAACLEAATSELERQHRSRHRRRSAFALASVLTLSATASGDAVAWLEPGLAGAAPLWQVPIGARGAAVTDGAFIYFISAGNDLVAVSAGSGAVQWKTRISEASGIASGSRLLISGQLILAGDDDLVAFERDSGARRWRFRPSHGYGPGLSPGDADQGVIVTGSTAGRIYAVDERTGAEQWTATVADDGRTTVFPPTIEGDAVVATYTTFGATALGGIVALDLTSGQERWRRPFPDPIAGGDSSAAAGGPIVAGDVVIASDSLGRIHGIEFATGRIRWSIPWSPGPTMAAAESRAVEFRPLAAEGELLFAASLHGIVSAYDLRTLQERWRYYDGANGSAGFQIRVVEGRLFVPFVSAGLVRLRARDGQEIWRTDRALTGLAWPPLVTGRRIYVTSASALLAFEEPR